MTRSYTIPRNFRRVVRRILRHGTYTCCQLSYDVGQWASIVAPHRAWNCLPIFILYAKWKTPFVGDERGRSSLRIRREKLYENRSYVRAWRRSRLDPAVDGKSPRPAVPSAVVAVALDPCRSRRPVDQRRGVGRRARPVAPARRRSLADARDRSICGRSRPSGNPRGSANTYTSRAPTPAARSGTPPSPIRT